MTLKARHQPYWINIAEGVALGYRRGPQGGSWYARMYAGEGQYQQAQIGGADDHLDANAETVLTFYQAQEKARKLAQSHDRERGIGLSLDLTVAEAADKYLAWYKEHRRAHTETEQNLEIAQVYFSPAKSGRSRYVPLNDEGVTLFQSIVAGKTSDHLLFTKTSGEPWGKNHHVRLLLDACDTAKVKPAISFHELRHTYASHLAQAAVDLLTISKLLGHADTRITSKHYAHLADKTLAAAVTKLPSFGGATEQVKVRSIR